MLYGPTDSLMLVLQHLLKEAVPGNNFLDKNFMVTVSCVKKKRRGRLHPPFQRNCRTMTLTKEHLINCLAEENGYSRFQGAELIETLIEIIKSRLSSGEDVLVSGFGKFCVRQKRERRGRNPATGESMVLAPRRVVTFKWSGRLRDKINGSPATEGDNS